MRLEVLLGLVESTEESGAGRRLPSGYEVPGLLGGV